MAEIEKRVSFLIEDDTLKVVPASKGAKGCVLLGILDMFSLMKYRTGDPMHEDDYARLDALMLPGEKCPRRSESPKISDLPKFAWNRKELAKQLSLTAQELHVALSLPGAPGRRANGRWPTQEIAQFMTDYLHAGAA